MVTLKNKQTFYPKPVGPSPGRCGFAAYTLKCDVHSNRTGVEGAINLFGEDGFGFVPRRCRVSN